MEVMQLHIFTASDNKKPKIYHIVQNSGGKNFGELAISTFWQGKLWQMVDTCIIGRRKTLANLRVNYLSLSKS